jgi:hypothetical protein
MRYPTRASEPAHRRLRVPPSPLHDPSVQELHDESSWGRETVRCVLDWIRMGWSGRAPAPPASEAGKGRQRQGATPCLRHPIPRSP